MDKTPIKFNLPHNAKSKNIAYLKNLKLLEVNTDRRYDRTEMMKHDRDAYQRIMKKT